MDHALRGQDPGHVRVVSVIPKSGLVPDWKVLPDVRVVAVLRASVRAGSVSDGQAGPSLTLPAQTARGPAPILYPSFTSRLASSSPARTAWGESTWAWAMARYQ